MMMNSNEKVKRGLAGFRERLSREEGFSIIELLIAILLISVLTYAAFNFSQTGVSLNRASMYSADVSQELRTTMEKMTWQLRVAYHFVPGQCVQGGSSVSFWAYVNASEERNIEYSLDAEGNLLVSQGLSGDQATIATGVSQLSFSYYDIYGSKIDNAVLSVDTTSIKRIEISMTIERNYEIAVGTASEGHRQEVGQQTVSASGVDTVTIRNQLQLTL